MDPHNIAASSSVTWLLDRLPFFTVSSNNSIQKENFDLKNLHTFSTESRWFASVLWRIICFFDSLKKCRRIKRTSSGELARKLPIALQGKNWMVKPFACEFSTVHYIVRNRREHITYLNIWLSKCCIICGPFAKSFLIKTITLNAQLKSVLGVRSLPFGQKRNDQELSK